MKLNEIALNALAMAGDPPETVGQLQTVFTDHWLLEHSFPARLWLGNSMTTANAISYLGQKWSLVFQTHRNAF
jgi:hypothetical protein